jgi:hypothetical protein
VCVIFWLLLLFIIAYFQCSFLFTSSHVLVLVIALIAVHMSIVSRGDSLAHTRSYMLSDRQIYSLTDSLSPFLLTPLYLFICALLPSFFPPSIPHSLAFNIPLNLPISLLPSLLPLRYTTSHSTAYSSPIPYTVPWI